MTPWRRLLIPMLMACAANLAAPGAAAQPASSYRGRTVQEVIDELRAHGAPIIYSTNLLSADLRVLDAPTTTEPLALAREILAPHGLTIDARDGLWLVVRDPNAPAQRTSRVTVAVVDAGGTPLADSTVWLDSIDGERRIAVEGKAQFDAVPAGRHVFRAQAPGYARGQAVLEVRAGASQTVTVALLEAVEPPALDELLVTASRYDVANQVPPSGAFFTREEIENLSDLGDDPLRVTHRLPGIAAGDWSARSYVRGGDRNEMAIFFDGMELIEPFHFRDYQGLFSTIDPRVVSGMQIYSGGFPVAYGGALSGLSIIDARMPTEPLQHEIGLSFLLTSLLSSGTFADGRAEWVASARRGNIDRWLKDERGEPSYRDLYVHVAGTVGKHRLAFNALNYDDDILLIPEDDPADLESSVSESDATQLWLRIDSDWTDDLSGTTVVSSTQFSNERTGLVSNQGQIAGAATDHRRLEGIGLRQDWQLDLTDRQLLTWGFEIRELDAEYDYASRVDVLDSLAALNPGTGTSQAAYRLRPGGHSRSVYFSDRIRFTDRLVADLGVRWDKQTYLPPDADEQISGRSSLLYQLAPATDLRLSYGRFFQAEGLIELQVEDGVVDFSPAQDASHAIVSVEHRFASDVMLRGEVFEKITRSPRPRYENLFDPFVVLPELRPGRVRIAPERGESQGVEILAIGQEPLSWWAAYTWSEANDIIDGRPVPRSWDQRHSLSGGVTWNMRQWTMSASATYHTGWPTTDLSLETVELPNGSAATVLALGERNAQSFAPFSRVDFATSRVVSAGHGTVKFFVEVTNLLDRANPCCVEFEVVSTPGGAPALKRSEDYWLPATLNAGVLWEF